MKENVSLRDETTLKVGGKARYFEVVKTEEEVARAVAYAASRHLTIFVLGGGSNVLISDSGFSGVVIKMATSGVFFEDPSAGEAGKSGAREDARAASGVSWDAFVAETASRGLWGLENLSGIPGTVGAAPIQNIGAYGAEAKDTIESVRALNIKTGKEKIFSNAECQFEYRGGFFKKPEGKDYIILEVTFRLSKDPKPNISYKDLKEYFSEDCPRNLIPRTVLGIRKAVLEIRARKFPDLSKVGTAGSFFKNPIISGAHFEKLKSKYPDLYSFPEKNGVKIPLAFVLDKICGLKGFKKENVELFQNQPLVLVNTGSATAKEISNFSKEIKKVVKEKTDIDIEEEVVCI